MGRVLLDIETIVDLSALEANVAALETAIDELKASHLILTETGDTLTTDGTEQNVYINDAPSGVYAPRNLFIDFTAHTAGETVVVREYYRIKSGGNYIKVDEATYVGVQDPLLIHIDLKDNRFGVKVTIQKTVGTNRAYDWEVTYKI